MPTLVDKPETVDLLRQYPGHRVLCSGLSEDQWDQPTCLPGWTVRDVLSHIIGAEAMLSGEQAPDADISGLDHMKNPIAEANELWVAVVAGPQWGTDASSFHRCRPPDGSKRSTR